MPRILIVEDNEMNRDMLSRRLQRRGFEVAIAVDGRQGVEMARTGGYDVVLMDMSLPELDGWEATRQIRVSPSTASTSIIALTAHAMSGDRQRALDVGCDEYDTKPVEFERLVGKIERLLEQPRTSAPPTSAPPTSAQPPSTPAATPEEVNTFRHDLRAPLNLIIGYADVLIEDAAGPDFAERRADLMEVRAAGHRILDLVGRSMPAEALDLAGAERAALYAAMREPLSRISDLTTAILNRCDQAAEPAFAGDVIRIQGAAARLDAFARPPSSVEPPHAEPPGKNGEDVVDKPAAIETRRAHILVVDDVEDNRSVLERRLARRGHIVTCATGGHDALDRVAREKFDLILLDVMMPDLDGLAVLERLKAAPATRDIPVLMITALDDNETAVRCIERGAEDHLAKPFDPVLLRARIDACLEKKRLRDAELEYLNQVKTVIGAAQAMESGTYEDESLAGVAQRGDELGHLARVFRSMAAQVHAREERLHLQVNALRHEMGLVKRAAHLVSPQASKNALVAGQVFADRYEIMAEAGRGGMGIVYRALDRQLGEQVAIKTLHPEMVTDATALERFKSEIRLARHISDRNVVRIYDIGESAGIVYLTMEFVEGITVRELLQTTSHLSVPATLAIAAQLTQSLIVSHAQGVIHRDIKPENLLLDRDGALKVMDFGVARLAEDVTGITTVGAAVGTPAYMAPEQLLSEPIDGRTDLYSVGVVLYECLTGCRPFEAASPYVLIARVIREQPASPRAANPAIPDALSELILQLLAKEPARRPASAAEVARRLAALA